MIKHRAIIHESASAIADAAKTAVEGFQAGHIQGEETFTDRMLGAIADRIRSYHVKGLVWSALTLTAHQPNAQEKAVGADILGVLDINLPDYKVTKGYLAQAKIVDPKIGMTKKEFDRLKKQCDTMLDHTPDSFVFLYSARGIAIAPAISVLGISAGTNPYDVYTRTVYGFFLEHFECFIGDRAITAATKAALDSLRADFAARRAMRLSLREG